MSQPKLHPGVPIAVYTNALEPGGSASYALELMRGLRRQDYRVTAVCRDVEKLAPMRDELRDAGVDVRALEDQDRSARGRLQRMTAFASILREQPGAVLALVMDYFDTGGAVLATAALAGAAAIVRADLQPPDAPFTPREKRALAVKDQVVDRIVVGARENVDAFTRLLDRPAHKMRVVHTGIRLDRYEPATRPALRDGFGDRSDTLVVTMCARLGKDWQRKGFTQFLQMAAEVARQEPRAAFLIVGDGQSRGLAEQQARDLGLAERVTFAGWRQDLAAVLASTDVFVMPSLFEGGPTIVLEAMAMGRPVVATRVGMVPEVMLDGQTGRIVTPGDAHAMALAVGELLADAEQRRVLGERARAYAERHFSVDRMVDGYLEVFAEALARPRGLHRRGAAPRLVGALA